MLYLGGLRWWPGVLLGDLLSREFTELPLGTALAEHAGNTARAVVAVLILRRLAGRRAAMDLLEHVGAVLLAVAVGEGLSATIAMLALRLGRRNRVVRDGRVLAELVAGRPRRRAGRRPTRARVGARTRTGLGGAWLVETGLMLAAVAGLSAVALSAEQPLPTSCSRRSSGRLCTSDRRGDLAVAVASAIAVWVTANDLGAFVEQAASDSALNLQLYITVAALTTLCLAAIVSERQRAASELADSRARIAAAGARAAPARGRASRQRAEPPALQMRLGLARERRAVARPSSPRRST